MPKKPARNALYFYMKELEPVLRREGRVFPNGMADVVPIACPRYKALPDHEKARYEKMAKEYKAKMRGSEGDKYKMDNVGNILAHRVDEAAEEEKKRAKQLKSVRESWPLGKALADEKFYIINFQTMCETSEGEFLPAEMAIIEYSIHLGISKKYHTFIDTGKIPTGYRFACKEKSENEHQIPVSGFGESEHSNYRGMYIQLENFVNPNGEKPEYPPMFCLGKDIKETEYCLRWIHGGSCVGYPNRLKKVYELEGLVVDLYGHIGKRPSKSSCIDFLTTTIWDYEPNTKCKYHEDIECKYCSLGIIQRYAFAISDALCAQYDVQLTEKHVPVRKDIAAGCTILPPTSFRVESRGPARNTSGRGGYSRPPPQNQALPPSHQQTRLQSQVNQNNVYDDDSDEDDDDDDSDDDVRLRRPNTAPMMAAHAAPSMPSAWTSSVAAPRQTAPPGIHSSNPVAGFSGQPSVGRVYTPAAGDFPGLSAGRGYTPAPGDFPGLSAGRGYASLNYGMAGIGRGAPMKPAETEDAPKKFAGRAGAPSATSAPPPPPAWQAAINTDTVATNLSGYTAGAVGTTGPRPLSHPSQLPTPRFATPQTSPAIQSPPPGLLAEQNGTLSPSSSSSNILNIIRTRGRGILGQNPNDNQLPKGRGYAPPGMNLPPRMQGLSIH